MEDFEKEWIKSEWNNPKYGKLAPETEVELEPKLSRRKQIAEAPERSVIEVSMDDFELWLKLFPSKSTVTLKNRQKWPKIM